MCREQYVGRLTSGVGFHISPTSFDLQVVEVQRRIFVSFRRDGYDAARGGVNQLVEQQVGQQEVT